MAKIEPIQLFNGPIEIGLRSLILLVEAYPRELDLQRLVILDYFLVHSGDLEGGPQSMHPPSPLRAGEVTVRRGLIRQGILLFRSRGLIGRNLSQEGFSFVADDSAGAFLDALASTYVSQLRERAQWIFDNMGLLNERALNSLLNDSLGRWKTEFAILGTEDGAI